MKKRDLFVLGAAMLVVAVIAGNDARNVLDRLNSVDSLTKYSGPIDLVFSGCARYRLWRGSCYVDFRLSGGPSVGFRYHDDRANYESIRSAIRKGRRFTVTYGPCGNLYCWPAEIQTSGRVLVNREQSMAEAEDDLRFGAVAGAVAIVLAIIVFFAALRHD